MNKTISCNTAESLSCDWLHQLDPGTYYFAFGNGAHDALNNIMALQNVDAASLVGDANPAYAFQTEITEDVISRTAFAYSKTGDKISNQLDYADWNYFQDGEVTRSTGHVFQFR